MKTINIFGDTQREQWHGVVNIMRQMGGVLDKEGRSEICDELDRYIDAMEDANGAPQTVYVLTHTFLEYNLNTPIPETVSSVFLSLKQAEEAMTRAYDVIWHNWELDKLSDTEVENITSGITDEGWAVISVDGRFCSWKIEKCEVHE